MRLAINLSILLLRLTAFVAVYAISIGFTAWSAWSSWPLVMPLATLAAAALAPWVEQTLQMFGDQLHPVEP